MASFWFCSRALAEQYAKLRPDYPTKLHEQIWEYCGIHPGCRQSLAVDLACGTGISTRPLAEHFDHVIGVDLSKAQIDNAKTDLPNIQFRVGPGEDLSFLTNESVDLITTANGLHWFNTEHVFAEIKRVLRPRGVFAAYGYNSVWVDCEQAVQHLQDVRWKIPTYYNDVLMGLWRLKSPASTLVAQPFIEAEIKENIKVLCHWPLCGEFTVFPAQTDSNEENASIWWRHHELPIICATACLGIQSH